VDRNFSKAASTLASDGRPSCRGVDRNRLALIVLLGPQRQLTLAIMEQDETITALEMERQRQFIENNLKSPRIIRRRESGRDAYTLVGNRLGYFVTEHARDDASRGPWALAFCGSSIELRFSAGEDDQAPLDRLPIKVFTLKALTTDENVVRRNAVPWKPYLPREPESSTGDDIQRLHDFFRVTDQIELLMRDAEIFAYEIDGMSTADGAEEVRIREALRQRVAADFTQRAGNLADFLSREQEDKRDGDLVYLGPEDALDLDRQVSLAEFWNVTDIDPASGVVRLRRLRRREDVPLGR
jgi:hypothetical protein